MSQERNIPALLHRGLRDGDWVRLVAVRRDSPRYAGEGDGDFLTRLKHRLVVGLEADFGDALAALDSLVASDSVEVGHEIICCDCREPHEGKVYDAPDAWQGRLIDCPFCGREYPTVPDARGLVYRATARYFAVPLGPRLRPGSLAEEAT